MIILVDLGSVLAFIGIAFLVFMIAGGVLAVCNWLVAHAAVALTILALIAIVWTILKVVAVLAEDDSYWGISVVFTLLSVLAMILFIFMYIVPLWVYYGGLHSVIETVASFIFFTIGTLVFNFIFGALFCWVEDGPRIAICDFFSVVATIAVLYFINIDGIRCYLFDFLAIRAPFI